MLRYIDKLAVDCSPSKASADATHIPVPLWLLNIICEHVETRQDSIMVETANVPVPVARYSVKYYQMS